MAIYQVLMLPLRIIYIGRLSNVRPKTTRHRHPDRDEVGVIVWHVKDLLNGGA